MKSKPQKFLEAAISGLLKVIEIKCVCFIKSTRKKKSSCNNNLNLTYSEKNGGWHRFYIESRIE